MKVLKSFIIILILLFSIISCSSGEPEEVSIDKITPLDTIYSFESLSAVGFKKTRSYKVEGLTNAVGAYYEIILINNDLIVSGSSLEIMSGNKLVLMNDGSNADNLEAIASAASALDVTVSVLEDV